MTRQIKVGNVAIGGGKPFALIAGPCVIESEKGVLKHAEYLRDITSELDIPFIFKASYDKANRSSIDSYRGPGLSKGIKILDKVKRSESALSDHTTTISFLSSLVFWQKEQQKKSSVRS